MGRAARLLLASGILIGVMAGPAWAQQVAVIDISQFVPDNFVDLNGDGVPDLGELPPGEHGIWDDTVGALTEEEFYARIPTQAQFDIDDQLSVMRGPCGGVAISYDSAGLSIDAIVDYADDDPTLDVYTAEQAFTASNPFKVDTTGTVAYFGFTREEGANWSTEGTIPGMNYGGQPALHDYQWTILILDVAADFGGDPNAMDENHNAGLLLLGEELPFPFSAKLKGKGAVIDLWGEERLPAFDNDTIDGLAAGREFCFGEGWILATGGDSFPTGAALSAALFAAGFAGLIFNARPAQTWRG